MDIFDQATEQEEQAREVALNNVRNRKPILQPSGVCFNCRAPLSMHHKAKACFCDADCRDDWQKRNKAV